MFFSEFLVIEIFEILFIIYLTFYTILDNTRNIIFLNSKVKEGKSEMGPNTMDIEKRSSKEKRIRRKKNYSITHIFKQRHQPKRQPRELTTRRTKLIEEFIDLACSDQTKFGEYGTPAWIAALIRYLKEPKNRSVMPSDVEHWMKESREFFHHVEHQAREKYATRNSGPAAPSAATSDGMSNDSSSISSPRLATSNEEHSPGSGSSLGAAVNEKQMQVYNPSPGTSTSAQGCPQDLGIKNSEQNNTERSSAEQTTSEEAATSNVAQSQSGAKLGRPEELLAIENCDPSNAPIPCTSSSVNGVMVETPPPVAGNNNQELVLREDFLNSIVYWGDSPRSLEVMVASGVLPPNLESLQGLSCALVALVQKIQEAAACPGINVAACAHAANLLHSLTFTENGHNNLPAQEMMEIDSN